MMAAGQGVPQGPMPLPGVAHAIKKEKPPPEWTVVVARAFFVLASLFAALCCWFAGRALTGFQSRFEIGAVWSFPTMIGAILWLAPQRGQMSKNLSVTLLTLLGFVSMNVGSILERLTDIIHLANAAGKGMK